MLLVIWLKPQNSLNHKLCKHSKSKSEAKVNQVLQSSLQERRDETMGTIYTPSPFTQDQGSPSTANREHTATESNLTPGCVTVPAVEHLPQGGERFCYWETMVPWMPGGSVRRRPVLGRQANTVPVLKSSEKKQALIAPNYHGTLVIVI